MTLLETLICMLIISGTAAAIIGAFSHSFRFILRAGAKFEAMNIARYAQEKYRAIALENPGDSRLDLVTDEDISAEVEGNITDGWAGTPLEGNTFEYPGYIRLTISPWGGGVDKQIDIDVEMAD